jgi:amino acid permease
VRLIVLLVPFSYLVVGLFGVLTFEDETTGDILKNYGTLGSGITTGTQAMFGTSVIISMPTVMVRACVQTNAVRV